MCILMTKQPTITAKAEITRQTSRSASVAAVTIMLLLMMHSREVAHAFQQQLLRPTSKTSTTSTRLQYAPSIHTQQALSDFYQNFPIQSAVLTCGVKASVADTIAQVTSTQQNSTHVVATADDKMDSLAATAATADSAASPTVDWELKRNLAYVLYGGIFVGLMSFVEYNLILPSLFGHHDQGHPMTMSTVAKEVLFDNLIMAPTVWLPPAYFIKSGLYHERDDDDDDDATNTAFDTVRSVIGTGLNKYVGDVREHSLLTKYWSIWFPAQTISFSFVPDHLRVLFMSTVSFFWFLLLSSTMEQQSNSGIDKPTNE